MTDRKLGAGGMAIAVLAAVLYVVGLCMLCLGWWRA